MKNLVIYLITLLSLLYTSGQAYSQGPPEQGRGFKSIILQGKVIDDKGNPVSDASVFILQNIYDSVNQVNKDLLVYNTETENNGDFIFENFILSKNYKLRITSFEHDRFEKTFSELNIQSSQPTPGMILDLGKIVLTENIQTTELGGFVLVSKKPLFTLDADKKIFNVSESTVSEGGTAEDVLKNVPSVVVDLDGNVTMRNASPQIFVDGKPTTLSLDQIPSETIETIEIITNPSAKYDASGGGAGILNIVLKKNKKSGYNGNVKVGGTSLYGTNLGADFAFRQNKFNFSASYNYRLFKGKHEGSVDRNNFDNNNPYTRLTQNNEGDMQGGGHNAKIGLDYLLTNKITLSASGNINFGNHKMYSIQSTYTDSLFANPTNDRTFFTRETANEFERKNFGFDFGYKQLFDKVGQELTFDFTYRAGSNDKNSLYTSTYLLGDEGSAINRINKQKVDGFGDDSRVIAELNFVSTYKHFKLESGLRAAIRNRTTVNDNYFDYGNSGTYVFQYNPASNFTNRDDVYAAYVSLSKQYQKFGYKAGVRAESFNYNGTLTNSNESFKNTYPLNLFPSLFGTYKLNDDADLQLSYTRRVERPNFRQLIPFVDSVDIFNINRGNPNLVPEITDALEFSYMKRYAKNSFLASVYYRYTDNLITRYIERIGEDLLVNTYINANSSYNAGIELTGVNYFGKIFTATSNVNLFNSKINRGDNSAYNPDALWSWFAKLNLDVKLPKDFSVQVTGMYQSRTNIMSAGAESGMMGPPGAAMSSSQGYIKSFYEVNLAVKKNLWNNKATISASINDIFKSRYNTSVTESEYFYQYYERIMNPRMVRVNFTYKFGKQDVLVFKRKTKGIFEDSSE